MVCGSGWGYFGWKKKVAINDSLGVVAIVFKNRLWFPADPKQPGGTDESIPFSFKKKHLYLNGKMKSYIASQLADNL